MAVPDENDPAVKSKKDPKPNWINNLAQRSSGLPGTESPKRPQAGGDSSLWSLAGLGIQFAVSVGLLAYLGVWLDRKFGWTPWAVVTLTSLAVIGNLYLLIKESLRRESAPKRSGPSGSNSR